MNRPIELVQGSSHTHHVMIREKKITANTDFYSASACYVPGIPVDVYPLVFAVSRVSGWTAHVLAQRRVGIPDLLSLP